jgi:hypothetical protein
MNKAFIEGQGKQSMMLQNVEVSAPFARKIPMMLFCVKASGWALIPKNVKLLNRVGQRGYRDLFPKY